MNPIKIRGVTYPSQRAAARALNTSDGAIYDALSRGSLNNIGLGRGSNNAIPCTYNNVSYPSFIEMSRQLNLSINTVYKLLKRGRYGR